MHSTGEKVCISLQSCVAIFRNFRRQTLGHWVRLFLLHTFRYPVFAENIINEDPHIVSSVVFGRQRFNAGVIVELKPEYRFDASDETKLAEWRNKIWSVIFGFNNHHSADRACFQALNRKSELLRPPTLEDFQGGGSNHLN